MLWKLLQFSNKDYPIPRTILQTHNIPLMRAQPRWTLSLLVAASTDEACWAYLPRPCCWTSRRDRTTLAMGRAFSEEFHPNTRSERTQTRATRTRSDSRMFFEHANAEESIFEMKQINSESPLDQDDVDLFDVPSVSFEQAQQMTVSQIKQQLRLRGLKVSGKKQELIDRLIQPYKSSPPSEESSQQDIAKSKRDKIIQEELGKKIVDVTPYLESSSNVEETNNDEVDGAEVWGSSAKIIMDDASAQNPVVDNISRTVIEYKGHNRQKVQAYVSASRQALQAYLAGGVRASQLTPAQQVAQEQMRREKAEKQYAGSSVEGIDDPQYKDGFYHVEDYSDVGLYTVTGAKKSAAEVEGILLLSDVYGFENQDTRALCDKIAFECQPCVVLCPDLFRSHPWHQVNDGLNEKGETYEDWRANHDDERLSIDIRVAAAVLRERYGVSSVVVFGTCFGGGRALEAAAGWCPPEAYSPTKPVPPPPVQPCACIAWYPTRYHLPSLFGIDAALLLQSQNNIPVKPFAVMAIFAGKDTLVGATSEDAALLSEALRNDPRVRDVMVKVFPRQTHGFAHVGLASASNGEGGTDAEVAALLSTAWLETYSRSFLPTVGSKIKDEPTKWSQLEMPNVDAKAEPMTNNQDVDESWFNLDNIIKDYEEHDYGRSSRELQEMKRRQEFDLKDIVDAELDDEFIDDLDFTDDDESELDPELQAMLNNICDGLDELYRREQQEKP